MNVECVARENQTLLIQYLLAPEIIGLQPVLMTNNSKTLP